MKVIELENAFSCHCKSINQDSFNKQKKYKHISRHGVGTVTATVQCSVSKKKH